MESQLIDMSKKEIPETGSNEDITLSEDESITIKICVICNRNPCKCLFLICPFHGKIRARLDSKDLYNCSAEKCEIQRKSDELES